MVSCTAVCWFLMSTSANINRLCSLRLIRGVSRAHVVGRIWPGPKGNLAESSIWRRVLGDPGVAHLTRLREDWSTRTCIYLCLSEYNGDMYTFIDVATSSYLSCSKPLLYLCKAFHQSPSICPTQLTSHLKPSKKPSTPSPTSP